MWGCLTYEDQSKQIDLGQNDGRFVCLSLGGGVKLKQRKECTYQDCGIYYYSIIERSV